MSFFPLYSIFNLKCSLNKNKAFKKKKVGFYNFLSFRYFNISLGTIMFINPVSGKIVICHQ